MKDIRFEVRSAQSTVEEKMKALKDYVVNNPKETIILMLVGTTVMHEVGYFIRSIKLR